MLEEDILTEAPPIFPAEILRAVCTSTRHRGRVNPKQVTNERKKMTETQRKE
jgi:hypothetical protein